MRLIVPSHVTDATVKLYIAEAESRGLTLDFRVQDFINSKHPSTFIHGDTRVYDSDVVLDQCCVCYMTTSSTTRCGHFLCANCYRLWREGGSNRSCPVCRRPF